MKMFNKNDYVVTSDGKLWKCICEDADVAVFGKVRWTKNGDKFTDFETVHVYSNNNNVLPYSEMDIQYFGNDFEMAMIRNWGDL